MRIQCRDSRLGSPREYKVEKLDVAGFAFGQTGGHVLRRRQRSMALSEDGQLAAAEQSLAVNSNNAHGAHGFAHVCYESGDPNTARVFLSSWLATYPRDGFFYGHLSWHLPLCDIQAGSWEKARRTYRDAIALDRHIGGPQLKICDGAAFLWRAELAGHPRHPAPGAACTITRIAHCRGQATGSPTCTSSWHRPW